MDAANSAVHIDSHVSVRAKSALTFTTFAIQLLR